MNLEVFEGPKHLFGKAGTVYAVDLQQQDGEVATDSETPQVALRKGVLGKCFLSVVAQCGCLGHVFGDAVVKPHLCAFEQRHVGAHVVEDRGGLEGVFDIDGALVLLGELQQMLAGFGIAGDDEGLGRFACRQVDAAAHTHDGVEGGADGAGEGAAAFDDVGMSQAASASQEFET